jgi:hypothetical protein
LGSSRGREKCEPDGDIGAGDAEPVSVGTSGKSGCRICPLRWMSSLQNRAACIGQPIVASKPRRLLRIISGWRQSLRVSGAPRGAASQGDGTSDSSLSLCGWQPSPTLTRCCTRKRAAPRQRTAVADNMWTRQLSAHAAGIAPMRTLGPYQKYRGIVDGSRARGSGLLGRAA